MGRWMGGWQADESGDGQYLRVSLAQSIWRTYLQRKEYETRRC